MRKERLLGLVGILLLVSGICLAEWSDTEKMGIVCQLVGRTASERRIVWHSSACDESMRVEYRTAGGQAVAVVPSVSAYEEEGKEYYRYLVDITGLRSEMRYEYRVVWDGQGGAWQQLSSGGEEYRALIFTDSQCAGDYQAWKEIMRIASEREQAGLLWLHLGDLVDCGASVYQWREWLAGAKEMLASCAFAPVMGNHEDYDCDWQMSLPKRYRERFPVIESGDRVLDGYVYSFDYGAVHYVMLDTQAEELSEYHADWSERQARWLIQDLASSQAEWKVIVCHKPFWEMDGTLTEHGKKWLPICQAYGVRLILSGHHHIYARRQVGNIVVIMAGVSGDGTGYEVETENGYDIAKRCDRANYLTLDVSRVGLTVRAIQADGALIDEIAIRQ